MNVSSFDLNHARALHHLLEEAHVARAARRLGITPAAASNALRRLRGEFDDELLVRQGRALVRTPLAEALRLPARELLLAAERLVTASARFDPATADATFDVIASDDAATALVPPLDRIFAARAPRATLRVRLVPSDLVTTLRGSLAVAVTTRARRDAALVQEELFADSYACLLRRRHPLSTGPWSARRFAAADHLVVADADVIGERLPHRAPRRVPTSALAPALLAVSDLVATLPDAVARAYEKAYGLLRRKPPIALPRVVTTMSWHLRHGADPRHAWLRQVVRDAAAARG